MNALDTRKMEIARHLTHATDDGRFGRIFELEMASHGSRKVRVSKQGQADVFVKVGKGSVKAECKTNGGRVEALYQANAPKFVVYRMDITFKHKAGKHTPEWTEQRTTEPLIIPTALFLAKLEQFGALKSTNGKNPEIAIQVSSKKWYEWLLDYPMVFDPEYRYEADDFDGLE